MRHFLLFIFLFTFTFQYDIIIQNGLIIDGTGNEAYQGHVFIKNDKIVKISSTLQGENASIVIDATNKIVTPGLIDAHAHGDAWQTPEFENFISQGITTICLGEDGFSATLPNETVVKDFRKWKEYISQLNLGPNIALFSGHSTLRYLSGINYSDKPTLEQLNKMGEILQEHLNLGMFGMTTGLTYVPGAYARSEELLYLAKIVRVNGALIKSHVRSEENDGINDSINELITQGEYCNIHVSHIKILYGKGGKERANEILELLNKAREKTSNRVTADIYPYTASFTTIGRVFPIWAKAPNDYKKVVAERREELAKWLRNYVIERNGPEAILFGDGEYKGKTLKQVSEELNKSFENILIEIGPTGANAAYFSMDEEIQETFMMDEHICMSTDGSPTIFHPRGYGSFARVIQEFVLKRKLFSLEKAIHKMSGLTAKIIGLKDRGLIQTNYFADILVFDPNKVNTNATYLNPFVLADGFDTVIINGKIVRENGKLKEKLSGRILEREKPDYTIHGIIVVSIICAFSFFGIITSIVAVYINSRKKEKQIENETLQLLSIKYY